MATFPVPVEFELNALVPIAVLSAAVLLVSALYPIATLFEDAPFADSALKPSAVLFPPDENLPA